MAGAPSKAEMLELERNIKKTAVEFQAQVRDPTLKFEMAAPKEDPATAIPIWKKRLNAFETCKKIDPTAQQCDIIAEEIYFNAFVTFAKKSPRFMFDRLDDCAVLNPTNPVACEKQLKNCWDHANRHTTNKVPPQ